MPLCIEKNYKPPWIIWYQKIRRVEKLVFAINKRLKWIKLLSLKNECVFNAKSGLKISKYSRTPAIIKSYWEIELTQLYFIIYALVIYFFKITKKRLKLQNIGRKIYISLSILNFYIEETRWLSLLRMRRKWKCMIAFSKISHRNREREAATHKTIHFFEV